jgi:5-methylcytosine-specific restriction protein A
MVTVDIGTTKRKRLTPTQRLKLFEEKGGICCICGQKINGSFIDEHLRALGLGGSNDLDNRDIAHPECAAVKTAESDMPRIVKAKAQKKATHGIAPPKQKISGPPPPEKKASRFDKSALP